MVDHAIVFLTCAWKETRNINECQDRDIEGVTETYKTSSLARCVRVEAACHNLWLVGNNAHTLSIHAGKTHNDVLGPVGMNLEELTVIDNGSNSIIHVVGLIGTLRDELVEAVFLAVDRVIALGTWGFLHIVLWDIAEELAYHRNGFFLIFSSKVSNARLA